MNFGINHNLMAMNVSRNLGNHYQELGVSTRRLSSGLRIGTAADDAAGLAVRELMRSDVATLNQGIRNANDAISMIQTADGALEVIDEKLIRMKELAEQASTGTYTSDQRIIIDSEFQAMKSEVERIAEATNFNGIRLLSPKVVVDKVGRFDQVGDINFGIDDNEIGGQFYDYNGSLMINVFNPRTGAQVWAYDGSNLSQLVSDGFGDPGALGTVGVTLGLVDNSKYIVATNGLTGARVIEFDGTSWTQTNSNGFGDAGTDSISGLVSLNSNLYASTRNLASGTKIYEYDGANWSQLGDVTLGNPDLFVSKLFTYNNELYATASTFSAWPQEGSIMKYDGSSWITVMHFFDDIDNISQFSNAVVMNGATYFLTDNAHDSNSVLQKFNGSSISAVSSVGQIEGADLDSNPTLFVANNKIYGYRSVGGQVELWSFDGLAWQQESMSEEMNSANNITGVGGYDEKLYVGTFTFGALGGAQLYKSGVAENESISDIVVHFGSSNISGEDYYSIKLADMRTGSKGLNLQATSVKTQDLAQSALSQVASAMVTKDKVRAGFGATQNRLENTISNLQIQAENLQAAESQISDVDVANEMTNFVKEQILSQAATAMLAQANSIPKMAIQLISGG